MSKKTKSARRPPQHRINRQQRSKHCTYCYGDDRKYYGTMLEDGFRSVDPDVW